MSVVEYTNCNRCEKNFDHGHPPFYSSPESIRATSFERINKDERLNGGPQRFDLCQDCTEEFNLFMQMI